MKTIEPIQIWDNGQIKIASILNTYASNVYLNKNANFNYQLLSLNENGLIDKVIANGILIMDSEIYATWNNDDVAWDFVANSLNLTITGDYIAPQIVEENLESNPESL